MNAKKSHPVQTDPQRDRSHQSVLRQLAALQDLATDRSSGRAP